jgi:hypothetical protein
LQCYFLGDIPKAGRSANLFYFFFKDLLVVLLEILLTSSMFGKQFIHLAAGCAYERPGGYPLNGDLFNC